MKTIRVKKSELLKKLTTNRAKHEKDYKLATAGFFKKQITDLTKHLAKARKHKPVGGFMLHKPTSNLDDYDRAIAMTRMSVDDIIELTEQEFSRYALDQWEWRDQFVTLSNAYLSKKLK